MFRLPAFALALAVLASADAAAATEPSGNVIAVIQSSRAEGATGRRTLAVQAPVFSGDRIVTGPVGEAQVRFRDNTRLVVGPNSSMTIDAFVFNADDSARQVSINAVRGAFRFITGTGRKDAYSITTPTASIGVRGTEFDVSVDTAGATSVAVFSGVTRLCDRRRQTCVEQRAGCSIGVVEANAAPRSVVDQVERQSRLRRSFRYVRSQQGLLSEFRVNVAACQQQVNAPAGDPAPPPKPASPAPPPPPPPPPPPQDPGVGCGGNCGNGGGGGGGNGTGNEGKGKGPP